MAISTIFTIRSRIRKKYTQKDGRTLAHSCTYGGFIYSPPVYRITYAGWLHWSYTFLFQLKETAAQQCWDKCAFNAFKYSIDLTNKYSNTCSHIKVQYAFIYCADSAVVIEIQYLQRSALPSLYSWWDVPFGVSISVLPLHLTFPLILL